MRHSARTARGVSKDWGIWPFPAPSGILLAMKRVAFSCAVLFALALLVGCSNESGLEPISDPGRTIVPRGSDAITLAFESADEDPSAGRGVTPDLKVRLPDEYLPSQSVTINLDLDDTEEQLRNDVETNFFGTLAVIKALLPTLKKQDTGAIVNISSIAALASVVAIYYP